MKNHNDTIIKYAKHIEPLFEIYPEQEEFYNSLYEYFHGNEGELDINKGLIITGSVGTGKTLAMKIFQRMGAHMNIISTRHIVREYMGDGVKILDKYGRKSFVLHPNGEVDMKKHVTYCFDDMLLEEVNSKFYGNQQNIMAEILLDRYDMFKRCALQTYATTNADVKTLEANYGTRVRDRIREMCNFVSLTGKSLRK